MGQFARRVFVAFVVGVSYVGIVGAGVTAQNAVDAPHPAHIHVGTCEELNPSPESRVSAGRCGAGFRRCGFGSR